MFVGEFLCCVPLLWSHFSRSSKRDPSVASLLNKIGLGKSSDEGYARVGQNEDEEVEDVEGVELNDALTGWRMMWMWFPAFFDSESPYPTKTDDSLWDHSHERRTHLDPCIDLSDVSRCPRPLGRHLVSHVLTTAPLPLPMDFFMYRRPWCLPCWSFGKSSQEECQRGTAGRIHSDSHKR
jgi:hypothetical protein